MCYGKKYEYNIEPLESYKVIRNCSGCGGKSLYKNTNNFRVNANGNKIDIWLIYQCEKCKHTFNLTVYERVKPSEIEIDLYDKFLKNDLSLSKKYGLDKTLFSRNRVMIDDANICYKITPMSVNIVLNEEEEILQFKEGNIIVINNPYGLKVRIERIIADILKLTRMTVQRMEKSGKIVIENGNLNWRVKIYTI